MIIAGVNGHLVITHRYNIFYLGFGSPDTMYSHSKSLYPWSDILFFEHILRVGWSGPGLSLTIF